MNICIITPFFNEYPNAMASAEKMAKAFAKDHQVTVLTSRTYNAAAHEVLDGVAVQRLPAWYIPEPANYVFTRGLLRAIWKRRNTTDIFIINKYMWPVSWSILFLKLLRKPVIVCVDAFQGYDWWSWSKPVNVVMWVYARTIGLVILTLANKVVVFHEGLAARAKQLRLNYEVIHNGIDPLLFTNAQPASDIKKHPNEVIVTYIGRLDKIKGYLDFLHVAKNLAKEYPQVTFLVVGNTHNREGVIEEYQSAQIRFTGVRNDIPNVLASSDVLVLPTYGDGLPNVIMEAMAAGKPCVASNINGIPYLIEDGVTGFVMTPGDRTALTHHLTTLINDASLRTQMGKAGRTKALTYFNWESLVKGYEAVFNTVSNNSNTTINTVRPKVVHLITGLTVGGAEQMLLKTVPHLEGSHSVYSIIPRAKIGEELEASGIEVRYLNLRSMFDIRVPLRLYRWLRGAQPDILVTYLLHADILGRIIGRLAGVPMVISSIRCAHQDKKMLVRMSRMTASLAHHYIAVSEYVKTWTVERLHVPAKNISIVYNGIEVRAKEHAEIKTELRIPTDRLVVTFIGRLDVQKGLTYLIEALRELKEQSVTEYTVLIVGDGPTREQLEGMIRDFDISNVRFLGFRRDIQSILSITDIFVSPTLFEGISNSIMEAMNVGIPVITTNIPENKELIENNQNGIVVPARDANSLANGLAKLLNDEQLRRQLGNAAQTTIRERFTIDNTIKQLNTLFATLYVRNRR